jgi:hypothetical protein
MTNASENASELETFLGWLSREGILYTREHCGALGTDVVILSTYTETRVEFRADGSFENLTSNE